MERINEDRWERREAYAYFSRFSDPFYAVTFIQDVTELYRYTKARGLSFYRGMVWACTEAVNAVPAFLTVVREGKPFRLERRCPSFTDLKKGAEQFHIVTMERMEDIDAFCAEAVRRSLAQDTFMDAEKETDDLIYLTCLPWIEMTSLKNERDLSAPGALDDSIPRLAWGRYTEENGRKRLGISLEVNHRFVDGVHIGRFAEGLTDIMARLNGSAP